MAVHFAQRLLRHAQKTRCFPGANAELHEPNRCSVSQCVRADLPFQLGQGEGALERRLHRFHRLPVELYEMLLSDAGVAPAAKMRKKSRGQRHRRLSLVAGLLPNRQAVKGAPIEIDEGSALLSHRGAVANAQRRTI